jgi:anti-sigma B factor antagonist
MSSAIPAGPGPVEHSVSLFPAGSLDPLRAAPGRWSVVAVHGDLDLATGPELDQALRDAVPADDLVRQVVLDLRAVTFLDCSGLRPLVEARRRLGDRFWLANVPRQPRRLLDLTGLTDAFAVLDDLPPITFIPRRRHAGSGTTEAGSA